MRDARGQLAPHPLRFSTQRLAEASRPGFGNQKRAAAGGPHDPQSGVPVAARGVASARGHTVRRQVLPARVVAATTAWRSRAGRRTPG